MIKEDRKPTTCICDFCKKELVKLKVIKRKGKTFVVCLSCSEKGVYPEAEIKSKEIDTEGKKITASKQMKEEKTRFKQRLKRQEDKKEKLKGQYIERAVGNKSI